MLEHYAAGDNNRYLQLIFFKILWPVRTSDRVGSLSIPGVWHKTDNGEVYKKMGLTLEGESYMPMSWSIDRGKGDIYWCWRCPELIIPQSRVVLTEESKSEIILEFSNSHPPPPSEIRLVFPIILTLPPRWKWRLSSLFTLVDICCSFKWMVWGICYTTPPER